MTDSRDQLRQRFRETLATRVQIISERLAPAIKSPPSAPARVEVLGELHTLKGEARMLGWSHLSTLAHEVEECLRAVEPDAEAIAAVLDSMLLSLSPDTDQGAAEEMWRMALLALGVAVEDDDDDAFETEATQEAEAPGTSNPQPGASWMQVNTKTVDDLGESLANLSGEFARFASRKAGTAQVSATIHQETQAEFDRLRVMIEEALLLSLDLRLTSVEPLLRRIAAHARVLGTERDKLLKVKITCQGARIERSLIDRLGELLLHLVNNAVDHGLEESSQRTSAGKDEVATLEISAEAEGTFVALRVTDDGKGVDEQAVLQRARSRGLPQSTGHVLDLLFEPGFSTKEMIDEVSGRGVGLDVVKRGVESLGGSISLSTELGRGTTFTLLVPAALTQERLVVVRSGATLYGISGHLVLSVEQEQESQNFTYQDEFLPRRSLASILGTPTEKKASTVCVVRIDGRSYALGCEEILGHFELIRRPTGPRLARFSGVSGSAQTDEGELVLLLDPRFLRRSLTRETIARSAMEEDVAPQRPRILVVDDSVVVRDLLSEVLSAAGYQIRSARNGREALAEMDSFSPALVLSDLEMPEMDGFRLLEVIRHRSQSLPVILVTARSSEADRARAEALGATAYVTKGDFQSESLVNVVRRLLAEEQ